MHTIEVSFTASLFALLTLGLAAVVYGEEPSQLEIEQTLSMEFETPHTDWAQPYVGGTVRALCFTFGRGTKARWIVELMQRFEVDATAAYWTQVVDTPRTEWLGGDAGERRILRLLEEEWDCFIFHEIPLSNLSAE